MNNKPDFQTEFIRFLKSRGYPNSGIFCNAKIGETHVDYLITVPNPNDNLAIIVAQRLNDNSAEIRQQIEMCRQEMGAPNYQVCLLTPNEEAQSKHPFSLYHLDNKGDFQEINFELLPTFQALSLNSQTLEQPLPFKEITKPPEMMNISCTVETRFQTSSTDAGNKKTEILYKKPNIIEKIFVWLLLIFTGISLLTSFVEFVALLENKIILLLVIISMIIFLLYVMLKKDDDSIEYPMPILAALNPFEIAAFGKKFPSGDFLMPITTSVLFLNHPVARFNYLIPGVESFIWCIELFH